MKNLFSNQSEFRLNEVVFLGRNKNYGAYILRTEENKILQKSMFLGIGLFVSFALIPLVINNFSTKEVGTIPTKVPITLEPVDVDDPLIVKPSPAVIPQQEKTKSFDSSTPEPSNKVEIEKPAPTKDQYDTGIASLQDSDGNIKKTGYIPNVSGNTSGKDRAIIIPQTNTNTNEIVIAVDVEASYEKGISAFRNKVSELFPVEDFEGSSEKITTQVKFIVEKDGSISNITVNGKNSEFNKEAEKTIKKVKGKWIPAQVKGKAVRAYFTMPITMQFE